MSDPVGNQGFVGQRDVSSATSEYNKMEFIFRALAGQLATATLVKITSVHPGSGKLPGTVDAQLLVDQQDALGNTTAHGIIYGLPFSRVQAGACAIIVDPAVGDIGVAVFASRDITAVKANTQKIQNGYITSANPGSFRQLDYSDGMYLFTALSATEPTDYVQILPAGGINLKDKFNNSIAMASGGITINGIFFPTSGNSFNIKTHTHTQPNDSHGDTELPTAAPTNGS